MGAQGSSYPCQSPSRPTVYIVSAMGAMKAVKAMPKGALTASIATSVELKKSQVSKVLDALAGVASEQVVKVGKFTIPGLVMIKTRKKPATKAGKGGVREGRHGESEARLHCCQGLLRVGAEEEHLSFSRGREACVE